MLGMSHSSLAENNDRITVDFWDPALPSCSSQSFDRFVDLSFGVTPCGSKQCFIWTAAQDEHGISPYSYTIIEAGKQKVFESNRYRYELELSARIALAYYLSAQPTGAKENEEPNSAKKSIYYEKYKAVENSTPSASIMRTVDLGQAKFTNFVICRSDSSYKFIGVIDQ